MRYTVYYDSPLGRILLACDGDAVTGLWFEGQKYSGAPGAEPAADSAGCILDAARRWLDSYFAGAQPGKPPPLRPAGTPFQLCVWTALQAIPYGQTVTYGALAQRLGTSPRALGSAVGRNPISLMIPCHRVLGADGSLTGYAGGVERKAALLALEQM